MPSNNIKHFYHSEKLVFRTLSPGKLIYHVFCKDTYAEPFRNGYFFNGPATIIVAPAAYSFQTAMMANHSAQYVNGYLDRETFKSFFGVTGSPGTFTYKAGYERIPSNWYRRAIGNEYTLPLFLGDVLSHGTQAPEFLLPGGNTGKPSTFTPLNITALTKGVFNGATLLQGNNLACFIYQILPLGTPDVLKRTQTSTLNILKLLTDQLGPLSQALSCPQLQSIDKSQYNEYPGYTRSQQ